MPEFGVHFVLFPSGLENVERKASEPSVVGLEALLVMGLGDLPVVVGCLIF
jgi:hypothetical protein